MPTWHKRITRRQVRDLKPGTCLLIQHFGTAEIEQVILAEKPPREPGVVRLLVLLIDSSSGYSGIGSIPSDLVIADLGKLKVPEVPPQFL